MDGYAAEFTEWSRIYFMLFYLVTMVIMTVVVTYILEAFIFRMQYRKTVRGHDIDGTHNALHGKAKFPVHFLTLIT